MSPESSYDVVLVGGGVVGSSAAMGLAQRGLKILVVDLDLSGRLSSSEKNAGGVRATWWQTVNIKLCRESILYYEGIRDEVGFRQNGYLWLYDDKTWPMALEHMPRQRQLGHPIDALSAGEVNRRFPEIDRLEGIAGATLSPADGLINPNLLKHHYRRRSRELGAGYLDSTYVMAIEAGSDSVRLQCWQADEPVPDAGLVRLMTQDGPGEAETGRIFELRAGAVAITGGAWSDNTLRLLGLNGLSQPIRRQICLVDNRSTNFADYGM
ncbi:MAG: NAD(P)/FAD-dependent oxidoreductase, partial [Candidatus Binataceae bacterium]